MKLDMVDIDGVYKVDANFTLHFILELDWRISDDKVKSVRADALQFNYTTETLISVASLEVSLYHAQPGDIMMVDLLAEALPSQVELRDIIKAFARYIKEKCS